MFFFSFSQQPSQFVFLLFFATGGKIKIHNETVYHGEQIEVFRCYKIPRKYGLLSCISLHSTALLLTLKKMNEGEEDR